VILKEKYEIYHGLYTRFELHETLSIPLAGVWQQVVVDYNKANADEDETLASFAKTLKAFFACHSTEDDQHEFVRVICYAQKPEHMKVQPFFYQLKELNDYVNWLPGDKPALSEVQLNVAFYNGMPGHWHVRHAILGRSAHTTMRAELLHYFCVQEHKKHSKDKKVIECTMCYKESKSGQVSNRTQHQGQFWEHIKKKPAGSSSKSGEPAKTKKTGSTCVSLTDKCPIHPDGNHKWGDCYQNILNKDKKYPAKGSKKSKTLPSHEANLMDVDPPDDAPINVIDLSGDECIVLECNLSVSGEECKECDLLGEDCRDCVLDPSNISPIMGKPHNTFATILAAKAKIALDHQQVRHLILFKRLSALRNPSHIILMKSHSLLNSR
jgi:hypothetical protein